MKEKLKSLFQNVDSWWFSWGSPLTLALLRVVVGAIAFVNCLLLAPTFDKFFLESGFTPNQLVEIWAHGNMINLLRGTVSPTASHIFLVATALSALAMSLGFYSRIASVLTLLGTLTLQHRNPFIIHGADTLLRITLIYLAFARSGEALSFDRLMKYGKACATRPYRDIPLWPQKLLQYQIAVMYASTVFEKMLSIPWRDGTAVYYVLRLTAYQRMVLPDFLSEPPLTALWTYGTVVVETLLAAAVFWPRLRRWALPGGVALHVGILIAMNVPLFCELTLALYLTYFSGEEISAYFAGVSATARSILSWSRSLILGHKASVAS